MKLKVNAFLICDTHKILYYVINNKKAKKLVYAFNINYRR